MGDGSRRCRFGSPCWTNVSENNSRGEGMDHTFVEGLGGRVLGQAQHLPVADAAEATRRTAFAEDEGPSRGERLVGGRAREALADITAASRRGLVSNGVDPENA